MSTKPTERIAAVWREIGLSAGIIETLLKSADPDDLIRLQSVIEERDRLHQDLEHYRERERQIAELIGSPSTDKLMHDLRNVLNELTLLRAVVETE